jgi:hypothetical protein
MHPKSKSIRTRNLTDEERRRVANKKRPFKVVSEDWKSDGLGQVSQEDMIILTKEVDAEIAPENHLNHDQQAAPPSLDFIEPYENAKYWITVPTRLDHASALPKQAAHPNMRFVGRKIRKYFSILDATKTEMWKPMEGVVKSYSPIRELGCPQEEPTLIWEDNKACILLAENESSSAGRCKHIDTKFRFVAEAISDGVVKIRYTPSAYNYSDILTKPLTEVMFQRMIEMCLGSKDCQIVERGCLGATELITFIPSHERP